MSVRHVCDGSEGCMCIYDPKMNDELVVGSKMVPLDEVVRVLRERAITFTSRRTRGAFYMAADVVEDVFDV